VHMQHGTPDTLADSRTSAIGHIRLPKARCTWI